MQNEKSIENNRVALPADVACGNRIRNNRL